MPLYEYECRACGRRFERIQKFSDPPASVCPHCGAPEIEKLLSTPAIQFKGSGWYITDYARKGGEADGGEKPAGKDAADKADKKDTKDTKTTASDSSSTASGSSAAPSSSTKE